MSIKLYQKYKPSGVEWLGEVPEHWVITPLYSVADERDEPNTGMRESNLLSLSYGRIIPKDINSADGLLPESFETYQIVQPGDIVLRLTDLQNDKRSLRSALVNETGIITSAYVVIKPAGLEPRFLNYLLRAYDISKVFYSMGGGLRQSMKYADLRRLPTIVPPTPEQITIASFLDRETEKIDVLVAEQQKLVELLKQKRLAVISHTVTKGLNPGAPMKESAINWLGCIPAHWPVMALNYRYEVLLGKMLDEKRVTGKHLAPYLRNQDVQWDQINTEELPQMDFTGDDLARYSLKPGDLLVCEGGEVGRAAIWSGVLSVCYYQKALHRLRPRNQNQDVTRFQYYLFAAAAPLGVFSNGKDKATIAHLTAEALRRYKFPYPPVNEQIEIADFLDRETAAIDILISDAEKTVSLLRERHAALISAAVTGQIDVRTEVEAVAV